jgi:hypothetical protein
VGGVDNKVKGVLYTRIMNYIMAVIKEDYRHYSIPMAVIVVLVQGRNNYVFPEGVLKLVGLYFA